MAHIKNDKANAISTTVLLVGKLYVGMLTYEPRHEMHGIMGYTNSPMARMLPEVV